ncbi:MULTISPECIES: PaaI family thioesterase [Nocardia]|uniref:PaaI family thioesterase n=1 Tax=Nocardia TaxID=1817 RepID=UPI000D697ABC|nr:MULTISPECIES: PaaI family thioesterase [Nocardia]
MTSIQEISGLFDHIGYRKERDADGSLVWELPVAPHVVNTAGGLQGGLIATLADIAAGTLALETRPPNAGVVTSDLSVRYFRPITGGAARAVSRIVHAGKRSVVVQVEVIEIPGNELAALATVNFATVEFANRPRNPMSGR